MKYVRELVRFKQTKRTCRLLRTADTVSAQITLSVISASINTAFAVSTLLSHRRIITDNRRTLSGEPIFEIFYKIIASLYRRFVSAVLSSVLLSDSSRTPTVAFGARPDHVMSAATGPPSVVDPTADKLLGSLKCLLVENFTIQDKTLLEKLLTSLHDAG